MIIVRPRLHVMKWIIALVKAFVVVCIKIILIVKKVGIVLVPVCLEFSIGFVVFGIRFYRDQGKLKLLFGC